MSVIQRMYTAVYERNLLKAVKYLIRYLQAAQGDRQGSGSGSGGPSEVYRDAEDVATIPEGTDVQVRAVCPNNTRRPHCGRRPQA